MSDPIERPLHQPVTRDELRRFAGRFPDSNLYMMEDASHRITVWHPGNPPTPIMEYGPGPDRFDRVTVHADKADFTEFLYQLRAHEPKIYENFRRSFAGTELAPTPQDLQTFDERDHAADIARRKSEIAEDAHRRQEHLHQTADTYMQEHKLDAMAETIRRDHEALKEAEALGEPTGKLRQRLKHDLQRMNAKLNDLPAEILAGRVTDRIRDMALHPKEDQLSVGEAKVLAGIIQNPDIVNLMQVDAKFARAMAEVTQEFGKIGDQSQSKDAQRTLNEAKRLYRQRIGESLSL